jgi:hypothetical protein
MWSSVAEKRKGSVSRGSFMQNMRVSPGVIRSRPGTSATPPLTTIGKVTSIFNWLEPNTTINSVIYLDNNQFVVEHTQSGGIANIYPNVPTNTRALSFADLDIWVYIAGYDVNMNGTTQCRIFDGVNTDLAFRGPITITGYTYGSADDEGGGLIGQTNIGTHYIGFVYQNRTGFAGVPVTTFGGAQLTVVLPKDNQLVNMSVTLPSIPDGGGVATLYLIMTRADNSNNWYWMPTNKQILQVGDAHVPNNIGTTVSFQINISDADMAASLDSANDQFSLLTQDVSGNGPFNPSFVVAYGQRMCYGAGTVMYVSNINNPQEITADQNAVTLPNQRKVAYAFPLPGSQSLFLTGDRWTAYVNDNNDIPATWAPPVFVSDALGAPGPNCVCYRTGGNYVWVATEGGIYRFTGVYDDLPMTYLVNDQWARVNWAAFYAIQLVDNVKDHKLYVGVPIDGATEPNAMFCLDYTNGVNYDQVDISLDTFYPPSFSALAIVKEQATGVSNLWIGPSSAGSFTRLDSTTQNDQGQPIACFWESGLIRGSEANSSMVRFGAADVWIRGAGPIAVTVYGPDKQKVLPTPLRSVNGQPIAALTPTPGIMYALKFDLSRVENATFSFETNAVNAWFEMSGFRAYFRPDLYNR